jgi:hypothetical protein
MGNFVKAMNFTFTRVKVMEGAADKFIYFFGRIILEDFMEITLVSYHGYDVAASKLVRSMYVPALFVGSPCSMMSPPGRTPTFFAAAMSFEFGYEM